MKTRPIYGALLASLLLTSCAAATPSTDAPARATAQSPILADIQTAGGQSWRFVTGTTAQAVSLVDQLMTACHESVARLTRH